jgi:hypothetical protein
MPFESKKQERYMFAQHPDIAKRWVSEAKQDHEPAIQAADIDLYRKQLADAYREMSKPSSNVYSDMNLAGQTPPAVLAYAQQLQGIPPTADVPPPAPIVNSPPIYQQPQDMGAAEWQRQAAIPAPAPRHDVFTSGPNGEQINIKPDTSPQAVKPGDVALGSKTTEQAPAAQYDSALVAPARSVNVPAKEVALMSPERIAQLKQDDASILSAQQDLLGLKREDAENAGIAAALHGKALGDQHDEILRKAQEHDDYLRMQESKIKALSDEVASKKIDPDHWWHEQGLGDRMRLGLAAAFQGFVAGTRGGPNLAIQQINEMVNRDIGAQRDEIESKKGQIGDMQGLLASAYRRFGNMDQAEAAARSVALQQIDAEQQAYAAATGSRTAVAEAALNSAQFQRQAHEHEASLYRYVPASTATVGGMSQQMAAKLNEEASNIYKLAAANGQTVTPTEARRQAAAVLGLTTGSGYSSIAKQPKGSDKSPPIVPEAPKSTNWDLSRNVQGTEANHNLLDQQQYNFQVASTLKKAMGERVSPETLLEIGKGYAIQPGDSQETIARKHTALQQLVASQLGGQAPATPAYQVTPIADDED